MLRVSIVMFGIAMLTAACSGQGTSEISVTSSGEIPASETPPVVYTSTTPPIEALTLQMRQLAVLQAIAPDYSWPSDVCNWNQPSGQQPQEYVECDDQGYIVRLYLPFFELTSLPPEIGELSNLRHLNLERNNLTDLPPEIGQLAHLESLVLDYNQLTSLPPEIGQLTDLRVMSLLLNDLTSLPPEIGQLTNLETLSLAVNQLTSLPPEIGELTNLQELNLEANPLSDIPPEICANLRDAVVPSSLCP
jgi:hypothetical protein